MSPKILALAAVLVATASAQNNPFSCVANSGIAVIARVEGITEQVGDLLLQCTGGTPTPSGQPIPTFTVQLTLNTNVTSRILSGNTIDAVLSIDDPYPSAADLVPQTVTIPANSPPPILCTVGSTCVDTGGSGAANQYGSPTDPYLTQPNIFMGTLTSANTVQWSSVPIDPPGDVGVRIIRLANVRANASQLGLSTTPVPTQVVANVTITGSPSPTINNPQQTVAYIERGLRASGDSPFTSFPAAAIPACSTHNSSLLGNGGSATFDFNVNLSEGFAQSMTPRDASITPDGNTPSALADQNIPGYAYNDQTMYYVPSVFSSVGQVGLADFGSRVQVVVTNTAAGFGVHLFVPLIIQIQGGNIFPAPPGLAPGLQQNILRLVRTDQFGNSSAGFTPTSATTAVIGIPPFVAPVPVAEMTYSGGMAWATYEVLRADPSAIETASIPVAVAFDSNAISEEPTMTASLAPAGAPLASIATASATAPIPRFAQNASTFNPYVTYPCALNPATNPAPADGTKQVALNPTLHWQAAPGAMSYDVYLGTASTPLTKIASGITATSYSPGILAGSTTYYWRVVANSPSGNAPSPMWRFTSLAASLSISISHVGNFQSLQSGTYQIVVSNAATAGATNGTVNVYEFEDSGMWWDGMSGDGWDCNAQNRCTRSDVLAPGASYPPISAMVFITATAPAVLTDSVTVEGGGSPSVTASDITNILASPTLTAPLGFFPLTPCRMVDTRTSQRQPGPLGPPSLTASTRDFPLLSSNCNIPNVAEAYSLNATVVPSGPVPYLSAWPTGNPYPNVSTLNSLDGATLANAAILSAGTNGALTVLSGGPTDLILDINGYLAPPNGNELAFFPLTPCRIADTRADQHKSGAFGPPALASSATRDFPIAGTCGIPADAAAYSLNMTVVPNGPLQYLSTWPAGHAYPNVSTLNSPDGNTIANAAIVPAGTNGSITVLAGGKTDLIIDTNGYFAQPTLTSPGLHYYALTSPCRIADTRSTQGMQGAFGPPSLVANATRDFPILNSACNVPTEAQAYALNITVVPQGPLGYLSLWPTGQSFPGASTLNAPKGTYLANAAIVPAGTNGAITVLVSNPTDLIIDINGYFAP